MARTSSKSAREKIFWKAEALRNFRAQLRGAPPIAIRFVPKPRSASLSENGTLSWKWHSNAVEHDLGTSLPGRYHRIHAKLGERFMDLADAPDEVIRRFAEHWGPLRYPGSHANSPRTHTNHADETESIGEWRRFATLARALVRCASSASESRPGRPEDWRSICEWLQVPLVLQPGPLHDLLLIASALNLWCARSSGNALVEVQDTKIILRPRAVFLFGIIGLQLAYAITGAQDNLVCHHCGRFYTPKNKPRTGSRNFCLNCRKRGKPILYAMRDLRARKKG